MMTTNAAESPTGLRAIGAVVRELGLTARAIRYYEQVGLLRPAVCVKGADRLFDDGDVERLREIKRLREVIGFSLAEIAELLETDEARRQLRDRFRGAADPEARAQVVTRAIGLAERRLAIFEHKLAQVEELRDGELARLERLRSLLAETRDG